MRDVIYYSAWLVLLPLAFSASYTAVLVWIWVALLPPSDVVYGTLLPLLPLNKVIAAGAFFALIASKDRKDFYRDGLIVLVCLFTVQVTLAYLAAPYASPNADLQYDKFWKEIVLFFLITGVVTTRHRLHQAVLVVCISLAFLMVREGLIFLLTVGGHKVDATGALGDNNGVALALLMAIPLLLYCARYAGDYWIRLGMYVTAGLGVLAVVATNSRGGFVGMLVGAVMLLKTSRYKVRGMIALGVLGLVVAAMLPTEYLDRINTISTATSDDSFETRLLAWKINALLAFDHPFLGVGPYGSLVWENWTVEVGQAVTWLFPSPLVLRTYVAHSIYFQVLGDTGFVGFFLFLLIMFSALWKTRQIQRLARHDPTLRWAGDLARAIQVSLVVYLVAGAALSLIYYELVYIVLAILSRTHRTALQLATARGAVPAPRLQPRGRIAAYPKPA